jgi:superfamily II DNA or RNA helicase
MNININKEGYIIPKIDKYDSIIKKIRIELEVQPHITFNLPNIKPNKFKVYKEYDDYIVIPKFYGIKTFGKPDIINNYKGKNINIEFKGNLRQPQENIINHILPYINNNNGGVLCLPCASGKTVLSLYLISKYKVKTLVIVHKTFLLNQWKERAEQFTNAKVGIIQQNTIEIEGNDIVIAMLQSIAKEKYDKNIFNDFGMVIFDEAHHAPSQYFSKVLPIINCEITIGLSATPKRNDKLEKVLYWYFGDIMYKSKVEENNQVQVNIINYDIEHEKFQEFFLYTGDVNRAKTINKITTIGRRNKYIIDTLCQILDNKRKVLILSDRLEHLKLLKSRLDLREITTSDYYIGGMKQNALKKAEEAQVIFATYGMASEALDIPDLNTLFMVTSRKEVEQAVGRILRKIDPNIRPLIYDFVDQLQSFKNQSKHRIKLYNKMGFEINIIDVYNNEVIINKPIIKNNIDCDFID